MNQTDCHNKIAKARFSGTSKLPPYVYRMSLVIQNSQLTSTLSVYMAVHLAPSKVTLLETMYMMFLDFTV